MKNFAQRYNFQQYDIEDGLVQSQVTAIAQDQQNRLWIASLGGLSHFNGVQFTNLSKTDGLTSNFVLSLTLNTEGNLLVGTDRGLSIYKNDIFHNYPVTKDWVEALTTTSGIVYGISGKNLFCIKGSKITRINITGDTAEIVTALKTDSKGRTWAAVYPYGLYYLEGKQWKKKNISPEAGHLVITNMLSDSFSADKLWLLTPDGIYIAENGKIQKAYTEIIKKANAINQDEHGNIWLGTNKGAWFISPGQQIHFNSKNGFTDNVVNRIFRDSENNIWLGTDGSGIYKFNSKSYVTYDESQGLQNNIVMSMIEGPNPDEIWIGTYDGIFVHQKSQIKRLAIPSDNEDARRINFLFKDSNRNIWIGTVGGGLWIYKDGNFKRIDRGNRAITSNAILEDRHKNIWISTNLGCFILDHQTKKISRINKHYATSLLEIGDEIMLAGSQNGVDLIRGKKNISPLKFNPIVGASILSMLKYKDHVLFGTADNGLIIWNITTGKVKQISTRDGLSSDHVYSLLLDKKGIIWIGTGRGINRIWAKDFSILANNNENTLLVECNQNAVLAHRGNIWIGTTKGAVVYNNDNTAIPLKRPSIFINSVNILVQNKKGIQNQQQVTYKEYQLNKKIILPYNHNHLNISFTGIYLTNPKIITYQYRLKGLDEKYSRPTANTSVNYTALPPGTYTFQVKAVTASGIKSANTATFELEITPPYYQTTIFKLFILAVILLLIMTTIYVIINLNEKQRQLRLKIKLEEQFKIRKQTAEDFHDDLGNKLTRISVLSEVLSSMTDQNDHEKKAIIQKIKTNVNELYNGTKDILWSLNPKNDTLGELLAHIKEFGSDMFNDTPIVFDEDTDIHDIDALKRLSMEMSRNILMIFKEAINNALKYSKADQVTFSAKMNDEHLEIQLQDNGTGFDTTLAKNGHGVQNMQTRAGRIKGILTMTSTLQGTTIALSVKL
uniref:ligand-binding sensor domain-containing protein n=1 Tax=Pedobacter schmidteae TaxID=2201271 RepID=UPI000EAC8879|nr:sensor histidine kinase [Pedobacter schmidteae]